MLLGLVLRQKAKAMRSIRIWREEKKGVLPGPSVGPYPGIAPTYTGDSEKIPGAIPAMGTGSTGKSRAGMGFGRQGLKAAEARGMWCNCSMIMYFGAHSFLSYRIRDSRT